MYLCYNQATVYLFVAVCNHLPETYHCVPPAPHPCLFSTLKQWMPRVLVTQPLVHVCLCESLLTGSARWGTNSCYTQVCLKKKLK